MQVDYDFQLVDFSDLEHGSIFLTDFEDELVTLAIKGFVEEESGHLNDRLVTVGPFTPGDNDQPTIYKPVVLRARPVLEVTKTYCFVPSLDPRHLLPELPYGPQKIGHAFLLENKVLLAVSYYDHGPRARIGFLDIGSGELVFDIDHDRMYATRCWAISQPKKEAKPIFEYEAKLANHG